MNEAVKKIISQHLNQFEKLVWCGQPQKPTYFQNHEYFFLALLLIFLIILLSILGPLVGFLGFIFISIIVMGKAAARKNEFRNKYYGITDRHLIVVNVENGNNKSLIARLDSLGIISLRLGNDNLGSIIIQNSNPVVHYPMGFPQVMYIKGMPENILNIENPENVFEVMKRQLESFKGAEKNR